MENNKGKQIHAPYNFVPFANKPISRYETIQDLPSHDKIDPNLKTGEIHVQLKAEMPIYIGGGESGDFFKGADGTYQIPGSSVRGMLRENMQILSMGVVRADEDLEDYQIYFRDMASARGTVNEKVKEGYVKALGVEMTKRPDKKSVSVPRNVQAGYLYNDQGEYYIKPSRYYRVSRKNQGMVSFEKKGVVPAASYFDVAYTDDGAWIQTIVPESKGKEGMKKGILLSTGKPVGRKQNSLYVVESPNGEEILPVKQEDILSYKMDFESRKKALSGSYESIEFWNLPEKGEKKAIFYIEYNGHIYFGMSLFLRVGYPNKISDGLPPQQKEAGKGIFLDYPHAIMGFSTENLAYRSRIAVGDFKATEIKSYKDSVYMISVEPKPSYYAGYLKDGKSYMDEDFCLRGYKQYWMREKLYRPVEVKNGNVVKKVRPFGAGTVFRGVIRYKNLQEDELGLLLWALVLEEGRYQSLGMGKAYGMGRVTVTIEGIKEINAAECYTEKNFFEDGYMRTDIIDEYIKKYKGYMLARLNEGRKKAEKSIERHPTIADFLFVRELSTLSENDMAYMDLNAKEYENVELRQEELCMLRKNKEQEMKQKQEAPKEKKIVDGLDLSGLIGMMRK